MGTRYQGLASTVTLGAAAFAAGLPATQAKAQSIDITVDGGASSADFAELYFDQKGGSDFDIDGDSGFFGSVAVSQRLSDSWDWRVSGSVLRFDENSVSLGGDSSIDQDFSVTTADAEIGHNFALGNTQLRLGFGILTARYDQSIAQDFGKFGFDTDIDYRGTGPKLSAEMAHPISADGRLKLIGGASVAPTTGDFTVTTNGSSSGDIDGDALLSAGYLGLSLQRSERMEFHGGLRVDRFNSDIEGDSFGIAGGDVSTTTAFVGLRVSF